MFAPKFCEKTAKIYAKKQKKRRFLLKFLKILQNLRKIFGIFAKNPYLCNVKIKEKANNNH